MYVYVHKSFVDKGNWKQHPKLTVKNNNIAKEHLT